MTPIEITEYKQQWMRTRNHTVRIHSDMRRRAKEYCKVQMYSWQWLHKEFTNVYEDTFFFEHYQDANAFRKYFKEWINE